MTHDDLRYSESDLQAIVARVARAVSDALQATFAAQIAARDQQTADATVKALLAAGWLHKPEATDD